MKNQVKIKKLNFFDLNEKEEQNKEPKEQQQVQYVDIKDLEPEQIEFIISALMIELRKMGNEKPLIEVIEDNELSVVINDYKYPNWAW